MRALLAILAGFDPKPAPPPPPPPPPWYGIAPSALARKAEIMIGEMSSGMIQSKDRAMSAAVATDDEAVEQIFLGQRRISAY
jgi:hypothetical protein